MCFPFSGNTTARGCICERERERGRERERKDGKLRVHQARGLSGAQRKDEQRGKMGRSRD